MAYRPKIEILAAVLEMEFGNGIYQINYKFKKIALNRYLNLLRGGLKFFWTEPFVNDILKYYKVQTIQISPILSYNHRRNTNCTYIFLLTQNTRCLL